MSLSMTRLRVLLHLGSFEVLEPLELEFLLLLEWLRSVKFEALLSLLGIGLGLAEIGKMRFRTRLCELVS